MFASDYYRQMEEKYYKESGKSSPLIEEDLKRAYYVSLHVSTQPGKLAITHPSYRLA